MASTMTSTMTKLTTPPQADDAHTMVERICCLIDTALENGDPPPTLAQLGAELVVSPTHLQRVFKRVTGVSPKGYAQQRLADRARQGLEAGATVTEAAMDAGYGSLGRFYENAAPALGMHPSAYRKGGDGMRIWFTITPCSLGWAMVAATERGVCAIELADSEAAAEERLRQRLPQATLLPDHPQAEGWFRQAVAQIDHPQRALDLPLDIRGTAFQRQVWETLRRIPSGETMTYSEVAAALERPKAARAVANACASNRIAVAIPCHRVVRADGGLGGYRWGLDRKQALLDREAAAAD